MKRTIFLIKLLLFFYLGIGQTPTNDPHWQIIWQDDFAALDLSKWYVHNNFDNYASTHSPNAIDRKLVFLNKNSNVRVESGNLILQVNKENYSCPSSTLYDWGCSSQAQTGQTYNYAGGYIQTLNQDNHYGFIEARIKIPDKTGLISAFWTFNKDGMTDYNEIDIFEMVPGSTMLGIYHDKNVMSSNLITDIGDDKQINTITDYTQWHTYGIEWSPDRVLFYVDNEIVRYTSSQDILNPQRLIFDIGLNGWQFPPNTSFPSIMYVDWVKVYDLKRDCNTSIDACFYNLNGYDNKVKKNIKIGGNGCQNTTSSSAFLRASEEIEIIGEFTVPIGNVLYLGVNPCY
jgi:beta-glucanase (GH16 family)